MKRPSEKSRGRDSFEEGKALALAVMLGWATVAGVGKYIAGRVEEALEGKGGSEISEIEEAEEEMRDTGEMEELISLRPVDNKLMEVRTVTGRDLREVVLDPHDSEGANELVFTVESFCDRPLEDPLAYDDQSMDERDECEMLPTSSEFSLCVEDSSFCMIKDDGNDVERPQFRCENYNSTSPKEACLDEAERTTIERAFYECRDDFLAANGVKEAYHLAQVRIFEDNMKYIRKLLDRLSEDENYKPTGAELMEYFNAYNQLRNLRDFDVVMDQLDLGERGDFVQIYGRDAGELILSRGCRDKKMNLEKVLREMLPT